MASVPGFLTKTFEIFSSPEYSECCGWGPNGDTIVIKKIEQFSKEVVPKFFKHSNFQSFVRQLNMYDFHKTVQDPSHGEFAHEFFKRGKPELLVHIKRKANKAPIASTTKSKTSKGGNISNSSSRTGLNTAANSVGSVSTNASGSAGIIPSVLSSSLVGYGVPGQSVAPAMSGQSVLPNGTGTTSDILFPDQSAELDESLVGGYYVDEEGGSGSSAGYYGDVYSSSHHSLLPEEIASETGHVLSELNQQRSQRESFERRMEQKLASLQGENNMLKRMFMESHHKNAVMQERMERVMKTLYSMFMGGGGNVPGMALTNRAPSMLLTDMQHFQQQQGGVDATGGYSSNALTVGHPLTKLSSRDGSLSRMDSTNLERLPSLDLAELNSLAAVSAEPIPPSSVAATNSHSSNSSSNGNNYAQLLLRRQHAGAALEADSRGNSFDLAASTVTAPSFQRQSTFDGAYLPIPPPPEKGTDHPASVNTYSTSTNDGPTGRVYLQPASTGIANLGPAEQTGVGRALAGAPLSAVKKPPLHSPVSSTIAGPLPLMRQRTFDYPPVSNSSGVDKDDQHKRKVELAAATEEPDTKKTKASDENEDELRRLESEDVQSSMHEAAEFMDLLNRNQQTTLTRLDSLEQTIASLFDSAGNEKSEGGGRATLGGNNSAGEKAVSPGKMSLVKNQK